MPDRTKNGFSVLAVSGQKRLLSYDGRPMLPISEMEGFESREDYVRLIIDTYNFFCPEAEQLVQKLYDENLEESLKREKPQVLNGEQLYEIRVHLEEVRSNKKLALEQLNGRYGIKVLTGPAADQWARVSGVEDQGKLFLFIQRLDHELSKYPPNFLPQLFNRILLGDQVFSGPNPVAGLAREKDMYISISAVDFKGTLHHEIAHFVDEYLGGADHDNVKYEIAQFGRLRAENFGAGAKTFIRNGRKGLQSYSRPRNHPSAYGATEINESQAEIVKRLYTDYKRLMNEAKKEPPLLRAINFMKAEYYAASGGRIDEKFWRDNGKEPNQCWRTYWQERKEFEKSEQGIKHFTSYFGAEMLLTILEQGEAEQVAEAFQFVLDSEPSSPDVISKLVTALDYFEPEIRTDMFLSLLESVADDLLASSKLGPIREPMRQLILQGEEPKKKKASQILENTLSKFEEQCALRYCKRAAFQYQEWLRQLEDPSYGFV